MPGSGVRSTGSGVRSTGSGVRSRDAASIAGLCKLSDDAGGLLRDSMTPDDYLAALDKAGLLADALTFLAHWLEPRQCVWWGCQCLWHGCREGADPTTDKSMQTIVRWVLAPSENARRQCQAVADEHTARQPLGLLAQAAFASGGSLAPAGGPDVPPPAHLTALCVAAALQLGAARLDDSQRGQRQFVLLGLDIARGKNLWS
jgi:hypothetical protein